MRRARFAAAVATTIVVVGTLSGCAYLEQVGEARDQLGAAGVQAENLDRLHADLVALPGVDDVEVSSSLLDYPPTADIRIGMDPGAESDHWLAASALVLEVVSAEPLSGIRVGVQQLASDLRVDYPAEPGADMVAEVELATTLRDAIGPGLQVVIEGLGEGYRTIGSLDRADTETTLGLIANAGVARQVMAEAPNRPTQWALPGLTAMVIPPDPVLALIGELSSLAPSTMPGDAMASSDEPFPWIGYNLLPDGTEHVSLGLVDARADSPRESALWGEYAALVRTAPGELSGVVVFNVVWSNGSGIVMRGECGSAEPTPDDEELARALAASGVPLDGYTTGVCLT
jgi:hypothetical protein